MKQRDSYAINLHNFENRIKTPLQLSITEDKDGVAIGLIVINSILGGCGGGLAVLFFSRLPISDGKWTYSKTLNGTLAGIVAMCTGCRAYQAWSSFVVGAVAGMVYLGISKLMLKCKLDDPLDAVAVHAGGGTSKQHKHPNGITICNKKHLI